MISSCKFLAPRHCHCEGENRGSPPARTPDGFGCASLPAVVFAPGSDKIHTSLRVIYFRNNLRRLLGYFWAFPVTAVGMGLALLAVLSGGRLRFRDGAAETWGGLVGRLLRGNRCWRGGAAMTLGHVILARDAECLERSRAPERIHVRQFERWGILLLPAYLLIAWWLAWRGFDPYLDHPFEREAFEHEQKR